MSWRREPAAGAGPSRVYSEAQRATLLSIARASIEHGLRVGAALRVDTHALDPALRQPRATFVTLKRRGALRGCIGTLRAYQPLAVDVSERAHAAAFYDPRFPRLTAEEGAGELSISISVLSPPEPMEVADEADALRQIRAGVDGLILSDGARRGTFLPSVWEQLPTPREFLAQLKRKAGLSPSHWSSGVRLARYTTESFGESFGEAVV